MTIFVSSSCIKANNISTSIKTLANAGFKNIELSGGTTLYPELENDLNTLKEKYNLNLILHNYFPPPEESFVLNLASLDDNIHSKTIEHYEKALRLSSILGANKFGIHAGYFVDIPLHKIGKSITTPSSYDKEKALTRFCEGFSHLISIAGNVNIYIENNVLSEANYNNFGQQNHFMFTDYESFCELHKLIEFTPLVDIAHLYVTATTLKLNFAEELKNLIAQTDYLHISDNNGKEDSNNTIYKEGCLFSNLKQYNLHGKDVTLEIYDGVAGIQKSYDLVNCILRGSDANATQRSIDNANN